VPKFKEFYEIEEIKKALDFTPKNDLEMRDRALIAILSCTAMRHESIITAKIGNFDLKREAILQDPNIMSVKGDKFINTKIIAIDDGLKQIIIDWVRYLKEELKFTDNDPIFPKEKLQHNEYKQFVGGVALSKEHMKNHHSIPKIIDRIFSRVGIKYHNPHSFRDMLVAYVVKNHGIQELAALSLNLGHKDISITLGNYYQPTPEQQFDILSKIGNSKNKEGDISNDQVIEFLKTQMKKE
jgi:integrase